MDHSQNLVETESHLPPIPRPLTRGSIPPDFKIFEELGNGKLLIKPGPAEILEQVDGFVKPKKSYKSIKKHSDDDSSECSTDLENDLDFQNSNQDDSLATTSSNAHLYSYYKKQCDLFSVVPVRKLYKEGGLELSVIDLSYRYLGPRPIAALARALCQNACVTNLKIKGNDIGIAGSIAVFDMLKDNYLAVEITSTFYIFEH